MSSADPSSPQALPRRKKKSLTDSSIGHQVGVDPTSPERNSTSNGRHCVKTSSVTSSERGAQDDDVTEMDAFPPQAVNQVPSRPQRRETVYTIELNSSEDRDVPGIAVGVGRRDPGSVNTQIKGRGDEVYTRRESGLYYRVGGLDQGAWEAGLREGDELLAVNGLKVELLSSLEAVEMLVEEARRSVSFRVSVTRPKRSSSLAGISDVIGSLSDVTESVSDVTTASGLEQAGQALCAAKYSTGIDHDSVEMDSPFDLAYDIELMKEENGKSLGLGIVGGLDAPKGPIGFFVKTIYPNGLAAESGQLSVGDELLALNGELLEGLRHREAVGLFQRLEPGRVLLTVREGFRRLDRANSSEGEKSVEATPVVVPPRHKRGSSSRAALSDGTTSAAQHAETLTAAESREETDTLLHRPNSSVLVSNSRAAALESWKDFKQNDEIKSRKIMSDAADFSLSPDVTEYESHTLPSKPELVPALNLSLSSANMPNNALLEGRTSDLNMVDAYEISIVDVIPEGFEDSTNENIERDTNDNHMINDMNTAEEKSSFNQDDGDIDEEFHVEKIRLYNCQVVTTVNDDPRFEIPSSDVTRFKGSADDDYMEALSTDRPLSDSPPPLPLSAIPPIPSSSIPLMFERSRRSVSSDEFDPQVPSEDLDIARGVALEDEDSEYTHISSSHTSEAGPMVELAKNIENSKFLPYDDVRKSSIASASPSGQYVSTKPRVVYDDDEDIARPAQNLAHAHQQHFIPAMDRLPDVVAQPLQEYLAPVESVVSTKFENAPTTHNLNRSGMEEKANTDAKVRSNEFSSYVSLLHGSVYRSPFEKSQQQSGGFRSVSLREDDNKQLVTTMDKLIDKRGSNPIVALNETEMVGSHVMEYNATTTFAAAETFKDESCSMTEPRDVQNDTTLHSSFVNDTRSNMPIRQLEQNISTSERMDSDDDDYEPLDIDEDQLEDFATFQPPALPLSPPPPIPTSSLPASEPRLSSELPRFSASTKTLGSQENAKIFYDSKKTSALDESEASSYSGNTEMMFSPSTLPPPSGRENKKSLEIKPVSSLTNISESAVSLPSHSVLSQYSSTSRAQSTQRPPTEQSIELVTPTAVEPASSTFEPSTGPLPNDAFSKSLRNLTRDEMISNVMKDYYTAEDPPQPPAAEEKKKPPKPLIAQALLPKSRRTGTQAGAGSTQPILLSSLSENASIPTAVGATGNEASTSFKVQNGLNVKISTSVVGCSQISAVEAQSSASDTNSYVMSKFLEDQSNQSSFSSRGSVCSTSDHSEIERDMEKVEYGVNVAGSKEFFEGLKTEKKVIGSTRKIQLVELESEPRMLEESKTNNVEDWSSGQHYNLKEANAQSVLSAKSGLLKIESSESDVNADSKFYSPNNKPSDDLRLQEEIVDTKLPRVSEAKALFESLKKDNTKHDVMKSTKKSEDTSCVESQSIVEVKLEAKTLSSKSAGQPATLLLDKMASTDSQDQNIEDMRQSNLKPTATFSENSKAQNSVKALHIPKTLEKPANTKFPGVSPAIEQSAILFPNRFDVRGFSESEIASIKDSDVSKAIEAPGVLSISQSPGVLSVNKSPAVSSVSQSPVVSSVSQSPVVSSVSQSPSVSSVSQLPVVSSVSQSPSVSSVSQSPVVSSVSAGSSIKTISEKPSSKSSMDALKTVKPLPFSMTPLKDPEMQLAVASTKPNDQPTVVSTAQTGHQSKDPDSEESLPANVNQSKAFFEALKSQQKLKAVERAPSVDQRMPDTKTTIDNQSAGNKSSVDNRPAAVVQPIHRSGSLQASPGLPGKIRRPAPPVPFVKSTSFSGSTRPAGSSVIDRNLSITTCDVFEEEPEKEDEEKCTVEGLVSKFATLNNSKPGSSGRDSKLSSESPAIAEGSADRRDSTATTSGEINSAVPVIKGRAFSLPTLPSPLLPSPLLKPDSANKLKRSKNETGTLK